VWNNQPKNLCFKTTNLASFHFETAGLTSSTYLTITTLSPISALNLSGAHSTNLIPEQDMTSKKLPMKYIFFSPTAVNNAQLLNISSDIAHVPQCHREVITNLQSM